MYKLVLGCLLCCVACQPQEKASSEVSNAPQSVLPRPTTVAPPAAKVPVVSASSTVPLDSLRAFLGVRPMAFRYVADSVRHGTPTVAGRFIVIHELFQTPRLLYCSATDSARWLQFKLEPVGEAGTVGGDFAVDTVTLDPQRQTLLLRLRGHNSFWGGSSSYGQTAIVDVTAEPVLLFKTEDLREDISYGRDNDTVYNDNAAASECQMQAVTIRKELLIVGPPRQTSRQGRYGKQVGAIIRPVPKSMLPAGRYRYQNGRLYRVKQ